MKIKVLQCLVILTLILPSMASISCQETRIDQDDKIVNIPIDISSQRPIIQLKIKGQGPYSFIFDTGSSRSIIDEELAKEMDLEVIGNDPLGTPGSSNQLMSMRVAVPDVTFPGTRVSSATTMNTMALRRILPVDGILSPVFFSDYLITIDYQNSILSLSTGELIKKEDDVISFVQDPRVINIEIDVAGNKHEAHLDSGNPGGIDLPLSLKDKLDFKEEPEDAGVINTPVASFKKWKATLDGDVGIGGVVYRNPEVNLVENFEYVNLGYQFFRDTRITIDRKNHLIKFERSSKKVTQDNLGESNGYLGWYGGHVREILVENDEMYLKRGDGPRLKLDRISEDLYKMTFNNAAVMNELPNVRFEKDDLGKVIGLTFIFEDGREDFVNKDK